MLNVFINFSTHPVIRLLRWSSPAGAGLLFFPCLWGIAAASPHAPSLKLMFLFALGSFWMRSVGCLYNDWVDRDLDRFVKRTQRRPLVEGSVSSLQALGLAVILLLASFMILLCLNSSAQKIALVFAFLVLAYPWLKRITFWPQFFLGLLFSSGIWVGWLAVRQNFSELTLEPFLLYAVGIFWTLIYDTLYAYQDYSDDLKIGIKSSAVRLGTKPFWFFWICWGAIISLLGFLGIFYGYRLGFWGGLGAVFMHFLWQGRNLKISDPDCCFRLFKANQWVGFFIFIGLLLRALP